MNIPGEDWTAGESLRVEFCTADGELIDSYQLALGYKPVAYPELLGTGTDLKVEEDDAFVVFEGSCFEIPFNKTTGLIENARVNGEVWIEQGPFLNLYVNLNHLSGAEVRKIADHYEVAATDWEKKSFRWEQRTDGVYVYLSGTYGVGMLIGMIIPPMPLPETKAMCRFSTPMCLLTGRNRMGHGLWIRTIIIIGQTKEPIAGSPLLKRQKG